MGGRGEEMAAAEVGVPTSGPLLTALCRRGPMLFPMRRRFRNVLLQQKQTCPALRMCSSGRQKPARRTTCTSVSHQLRRRSSSSSQSGRPSSPAPAREQRRRCRVYNITGGAVPYDQAWMWQQRLLHERMAWQREDTTDHATSHDVLLLLEHPPVYTLGRGSSLDHLRFDPTDPSSSGGREVRRTERGGEVTWHGPGQIVGYPVLDLNFHKKDLHWYLRELEEVVIRVLGRYGLEGEREVEHTGVWVGGAKVAAIGLNASRWVTSHGFALNVAPDLRAFEAIVPCGIQGRPVTRLSDLIGDDFDPTPSLNASAEEAAEWVVRGRVSTNGEAAVTETNMDLVRSLVIKDFEGVFGVEVEVVEVDAAARGGGDELERRIFPTECEPGLLRRLRADSLRQLELAKRRR